MSAVGPWAVAMGRASSVADQKLAKSYMEKCEEKKENEVDGLEKKENEVDGL